MSVALCLISKTYEEVEPIIKKYYDAFDKFYVQLNGDKNQTYPKDKKVAVSTFKWCDDFAKARNALLKHVKEDWWMWIDTDDTIVGIDKLPEVIKQAEEGGWDAAFLPYEYGYNEAGELIALQWRERLIRTAHPFKWKGVVHETLISESQPILVQSELMLIKHDYKTIDEHGESGKRNHKLLEKAYKKDKDPRYAYYLGMSFFIRKEYAKAAKVLLEYTKVSGWDEQIYIAWMRISDCLMFMDEYEKAVDANLEAIKIRPDFPDAYLKLGDLYLFQEMYDKAIEWLDIGRLKPKPETLEIIDPTLYTYRPLVSLAMAHFGKAKVDMAKKLIDEANKYKPKGEMFMTAYQNITNAYYEEQTIKWSARIGELIEKQGKLDKYIDSLPQFIRNDLRLRPLWVKVHPPKTWEKNSIVFYCGEQWEEWGWDYKDKQGMGGSEEAITYLSEELQKLGWKVTVYNQRIEEYTSPAGVKWIPWEHFNPEDIFDVFIAWRSPWMCQKLKIKANICGVDMHDTPWGHQAIPKKAEEALDLVFFKSLYQRAQAPEIPEEKCVIASNGIVPEHFLKNIEGIKRNPKKMMYASSADRGLDVLVREVLPKVKEAVPDVELVWAYGWNSYDGMHKGDAESGRWKWELKRDMFNAGVKELGRLSHEDLAKEMASCGIWAYPTSFPEINCITALKMQAAGVQPITSGYAALQETVVKSEENIEDIHLKPEKLQEFTDRLIKALKEPLDEGTRKDIAKIVINKFAWSAIAKEWDRAIKERKNG